MEKKKSRIAMIQFTTGHGSLREKQKSARRHEARTREWQKRGLRIQNKTDTTSILALA
jgi:hypothetical protein